MKDIFLVDADDTVLDFHGASSKALRYAFEQSKLPWKEAYAEIFRKFNDSLWEKLERKEITRDELLKTRFPLFMQHLNLTADGEQFNRFYLKYLAENPIYVLGAENFLQALKKRGRVYIVTNGTEWIQKSRFSIARLHERIDGAFISDCIGYNKPAKGYTDYVIGHIENFDKERAVWIGDSLSADVKAANEAGIESIWFNPKGKEVNGKAAPDYQATTFEEILEILQRIG